MIRVVERESLWSCIQYKTILNLQLGKYLCHKKTQSYKSQNLRERSEFDCLENGKVQIL